MDLDFDETDNIIETYMIDDAIDKLREELANLEEIREQAGSEWDGGTLVNDTYFQDYAVQLAEDLGLIDSDAYWPNSYIDWDEASKALQQDYTPIDYNGYTFWIRA